eukprot:SM000074S21649  [mRNA]  locus=s74:108523:109768:+ [translate_table: standard]
MKLGAHSRRLTPPQLGLLAQLASRPVAPSQRAGTALAPRSARLAEVTAPSPSPLASPSPRPVLQGRPHEAESEEKSMRAPAPKVRMAVAVARTPVLRAAPAGAVPFRKVPGCEYDAFSSPLGRLTVVASPAGLHAVLMDGDGTRADALAGLPHNPDQPLLAEARRQLQSYFQGTLKRFSLPLAPLGTTFQLAVWQALQQIPHGETRSYAAQSTLMGLSAGHARAVGAANGRNPLAIIIPCHRVIGKSGGLTGYAGGLDRKSFLLQLETRAKARPKQRCKGPQSEILPARQWQWPT